MSSKISLCFICDEYYVMPTAVAITSLIVNKNCDSVYDVFLITNNLSGESVTILKNMETESVKIIIINADKGEEFDKFRIADHHVTPSALLKFELPELLPDELEKILYLDGDVIVQKDLAVIFNKNIENVYAGAVSNGPNRAKRFSDQYNIKCSLYFNSGVLLLNLKKMREDYISELLIECKYRNSRKDGLMDQDTFNLVFREKVSLLSFYYNFQYHSWLDFDINQLAEHYGLKMVDSKYKWIPEAFVIHYSSMRKPWKFLHFFASDVWFHYYLLSPFKNISLHRVFLGEEEDARYKTARIDIKNFGTADNNITIECCSDEVARVNSPGWFKDARGSGVVVHSTQSNVELEVKCLGDGNMKLWLRGMDCRDSAGKRYPVWICVTCLRVDGKELINNPHLVCHDKPFVFNLKVTNGQLVRIYMEWQSAVDFLAKEREPNLKRIEEMQQKTIILEKTVAETEKKLQETQQGLAKLERAKAKTEKELKNVKNGWSFKIGRIITYIPRKITKYRRP